MQETRIEHEESRGQGKFRSFTDGQPSGEIEYTLEVGTLLVIEHTEVDQQFKGRGVGRELVVAAAAFARARGILVKPVCPFARVTFERSEKLRDVLAP